MPVCEDEIDNSQLLYCMNDEEFYCFNPQSETCNNRQYLSPNLGAVYLAVNCFRVGVKVDKRQFDVSFRCSD